jgi:hypothetical protein
MAVELAVKQKLPDGRFIVELVGLNRFTKAKATEKILSESTLDSMLTIGIHYQKMRECLRLFADDTFEMWVHGPADVVVLRDPKNFPNMVSFSVPLRIA